MDMHTYMSNTGKKIDDSYIGAVGKGVGKNSRNHAVRAVSTLLLKDLSF